MFTEREIIAAFTVATAEDKAVHFVRMVMERDSAIEDLKIQREKTEELRELLQEKQKINARIKELLK